MRVDSKDNTIITHKLRVVKMVGSYFMSLYGCTIRKGVFVFYDIYERLCNERGEKPYQLPIKLGAKSNSVVAQWKKGSLPRPEMLQKIADFFGVSVSYLMFGEEGEKENPTSNEIGLNKAALINSVEDMDMPDLLDLLQKVTETIQKKSGVN